MLGRDRWDVAKSARSGAEIIVQGDFRRAEPRLMHGLHDALVQVGAISPGHRLRYTGCYRQAHGGPVLACVRKWLRRAAPEQRQRFTPLGAERARQVFEFLLRHGGAGTQSFHARFVVLDTIDLVSPWLSQAHFTKVDPRCGLTRMKAEKAVQQLRNRDTIVVHGIVDAVLCHAAVQPENDVCQRDELLEIRPIQPPEPRGVVWLFVKLLFGIDRVIVLLERSGVWMDRRLKRIRAIQRARRQLGGFAVSPPAVLQALLLAIVGRYAFRFLGRLVRRLLSPAGTHGPLSLSAYRIEASLCTELSDRPGLTSATPMGVASLDFESLGP